MRNSEYLKKVMDLAQEASSKIKKGNPKAKKRYGYWLMGLVFSFIPLFALPFANALTGGPITTCIREIFENNDIFFIGISLSIAALNDYVHNKPSKKRGNAWAYLNIAIVLVGAMFYGVTAIILEKHPAAIDYSFLFWCNVFYLVIILIVGSYRYIVDMTAVK